MKIDVILQKAYHKYMCARGTAPIKYSIWNGYRNEFYEYIAKSPISVSIMCLTHGNTNSLCQDCYLGIPINWTNRKRIECLPRKKSIKLSKSVQNMDTKIALSWEGTYKSFIFDAVTPRESNAVYHGQYPPGQIFYLDTVIKNSI